MTTATPTPFKRRFPRFSLRTLLALVCMLVVGVVFAWKVQPAQKQRKAVAWIKETGGHVVYSHMVGDYGQILRNPKPPGPKWLRERLGIDFFDDVVHVFMPSKRGVSDVTPLAGLTIVESLDLQNTDVSDLSPLARLKRLQYLFLFRTHVSDLSPLIGLTNLLVLGLDGTHVSDVTPLAGLTNLEVLSLRDTDVSDVTPLARLTNLKALDLRDTDVSEEDYKELQTALPYCRIRWGRRDQSPNDEVD